MQGVKDIRIEGDLINGLTFIKDVESGAYKGHKVRRSMFRCYCGNMFTSEFNRVKTFNTKSCGCWKKQVLRDRHEAKNPLWKGDGVGYAALHQWVSSRLEKPIRCSCCNEIKRLDLANISNEYKRDLSDWEWLCRKCHMTKDGRLDKLKVEAINGRKKLKHCQACGRFFYQTHNCHL